MYEPDFLHFLAHKSMLDLSNEHFIILQSFFVQQPKTNVEKLMDRNAVSANT